MHNDLDSKSEEITEEALIAYQSGNIFKAKLLAEKAIKVHANESLSLGLLATIENAIGNKEKAKRLFEKAISINCNNPDILHNYSGLLKEIDVNKALELSNKSITISPSNSIYLERNGYLKWKTGDLASALKVTKKAIDINPVLIDAHVNLGCIYAELGNLDQALESTFKSLELKPDNAAAHINLGEIFHKKRDFAKAQESYKKAYEYEPTIQNECKAKLNFPWNISTSAEVFKHREQYLRNATSIFNTKRQLKQDFLNLSLFTLAYQNGDNDRGFLEKVGKLARPWLRVDLESEIEKLGDKSSQDIDLNCRFSLRVGFYFDNIEKSHVVYRHYSNIVKDFNANGIDIVIIKGPIAAKQKNDELERNASLVVQLYSNLAQSVKTLKNLDLQMLIYTEIFSSDTPYCLAHNRIAPTQAVLPGNLITTGLPTIDFFVTSEHMETDKSHLYYTERLIKLKGMPHGMTQIPKLKQNKSRANFGLLEEHRILGLLHNLIKFHPDWDNILEEIACNNPDVIFILTGAGTQPSIFLKERWRKTAPHFLSRCKFYERLKQEDYFYLLACADIVLDPLHIGCGTTSIDALSMGIPIITKPENHPRTRIVYGLYKIMGIEESAPIACTNADYATICNKLLANMDECQIMKELIHANYSKVIAANKDSIKQLTVEAKKLISTSL